MIRLAGPETEFVADYAARFGRPVERGIVADELRAQISAALRGEGVRTPLVDFEDRPEFDRAVLGILARIPRGEVRPYAWVAREAGRPNAVRAVGNICARNTVPFVVPCHRVVPSTGGLGHYAFGASMKRDLLQREGVPVEELEELARQGVRYIGSRTTRVFCFPTCHYARRIGEANRIIFHDAAEAVDRGFRPCKRCHPAAA